jgi:hypothetical protein
MRQLSSASTRSRGSTIDAARSHDVSFQSGVGWPPEMNERELADFLPDLAQKYLEGVSSFRLLDTTGAEELLPTGRIPYGAWSFRMSDTVLVVLSINQNAILSITAGLALDVPFTAGVSHHLNKLNAEVVTVGRLFLVEFEGTGRGAILMQELAYCTDVPADHAPSLQALVRIVGTVAGQSARLSPELCEQLGGHAPPDEADLLILTHA